MTDPVAFAVAQAVAELAVLGLVGSLAALAWLCVRQLNLERLAWQLEERIEELEDAAPRAKGE